MYRLKVKDSVYTIPKENIGALAYTKAIDTGYGVIDFRDTEFAIKFLTSLGMEVSEDEQ